MESINFYSNGSPKKHKAVSRWFCMSCIAVATIAISLASLQVQQWHIHSSLVSEKNELNAQLHTLDHVAAYQKNQKSLQAKQEKKAEHLKNHNKYLKNPVALLKNIKVSLKNDARLEAVSLHEKNIELKITSEKTKTLMQCAQALSENSCYADLQITALECREKNRFLGTLKNN